MRIAGYGFVVECHSPHANPDICKGVLETVNSQREDFVAFLEEESSHSMTWGIENDGITVPYVISRNDS